MARYRRLSARREKFPWLLLLALLAAAYLFFVLPRQLGPQPVKVEFTQEKA